MAEDIGWIGVDLDGTLAKYNGWQGEDNIGEPIPVMVERIQGWLKDGYAVKIVTARFHNGVYQINAIWEWLEKQGLPRLEVTATKDFGMIELWDDRCVQVISNTGRRADAHRLNSDAEKRLEEAVGLLRETDERLIDADKIILMSALYFADIPGLTGDPKQVIEDYIEKYNCLPERKDEAGSAPEKR